MHEKWKPVPGYEGLYEVSDRGNVRTTKRQGSAGGLLSLNLQKNGYLKVGLYNKARKAFSVHRLVLDAFVGPCPDGMLCCHGNGDRTNNNLSNLRWGTRKDNFIDSLIHGTAAFGERNGASKLKSGDLVKIKALRSSGLLQREIATTFGLSQQHVSALLSGGNTQ